MKSNTLVLFVVCLLSFSGLRAQSIEEGKNHYYSERYQSAKSVFEKLIAANPNNLDAVFWLGETFIAMEDIPSAKSLFEKTLAANGNAPQALIGMGHVELYENKTNEARQRFETALTLTAHKRKGNDPVTLNAIGMVNVDAKNGNLDYALQVLKEAAEKESKNEEIYLNLGNAFRKAFPGQAGGDAYQNYLNATKVNPKFAIAHYRMAKLFETQKNWIVWLEHMNNAVDADPKFAPAFYDLYAYYLLITQNFERAEEFAQKYIANADPDVNNKYLACQTSYAKKDYAAAISCTQSMIAEAGQKGVKVNPKAYKLLAYSFVDKGDTAAGKDAIDNYFSMQKPEEVISKDYELKATVYSKVSGGEDVMLASIMEGVNLDTVIQDKVATLKKGADIFKARGDRRRAGDLLWEAYKINPNPNQRDLFDPGLEYYFAKDYYKADTTFSLYAEKWPEEIYGWQWKFNAERAIDTTMELGLFAETAVKLLDVLYKDSVKNRSAILPVLAVMATYHANTEKGRDYPKAAYYLQKYLYLDPENAGIKGSLDAINNAIKNSSSSKTRSSSSGKP